MLEKDISEMKILLINPVSRKFWKRLVLSPFPPLNLAMLAAYSGDNEIKVIDECVSDVNFNEYADLVGITTLTINAPRAYEIAEKFKEKGIKVVMGGIHPSMLPNEAIKYSDSVVIGEAENVWKNILEDAEKNRLKKFYYGERLPLTNLPLPRWDLLKKRYLSKSVQTSRGCPFQCEFCSVTIFNGREYRLRPVDEVINEINSISSKKIVFIDDNIIGVGKEREERAIELFKKLKALNIKWLGESSINIGKGDKILKAAADSGCIGLLIGLESIEEMNLRQMNKGLNLAVGIKNYKKVIKKFHDHNIAIYGSMIFGNDYDTKETFKKTVDFILDTDIDFVSKSMLCPFPGTRLYERLDKEKRILFKNYPADWSKYGSGQIVIRPKNMTVEELREGIRWMDRQTHAPFVAAKRAIKSFINTKSLLNSSICFGMHVSSFFYGRAKPLFERIGKWSFSKTCL